ncbi:aldehyde dehydrogenase [Guyanagaster necrorhizus]|uniref:Aldehyde dehydrogenase n=1 Tax=Guyanagaster necrorhizus TaxID=856835 RepID=A0A9P8AL56_9AGAR|nr:aldehyde dehydrogenase [Guyanagaster necrorhizus MCA 3950]KAG7439878.1 aldehyde dehydrogenase [Guyanagaster necrorhizus MCA 3950]
MTSIEETHRALHETFSSRITLPIAWRQHQLLQLARMFQEGHKLLASALNADLGRPTLESYFTEINTAVDRSLKAARDLPRWAAEHDVEVDEDLFRPWNPRIRREPKGVGLIISPWNFPFFLATMPIIGALAAGCCWVLKPSELAPNCASALGDLVGRYLDQRACRVVQGGVEQTTALLDLRWDHIFYTGNATIARSISHKAAQHLTPTTLELGGKCPVLLDPKSTCNMDLAAKRILFGKCQNSGQICVSPDYLVIPTYDDPGVLPRVVESFKRAYDSFYPSSGGALAHPESLSRIGSLRHFTRLASLLTHTKGRVVLGGHADLLSLRIQPTVVVGVGEDDVLMGEEIFGPVLPVLEVGSWEEAVRVVRRVGTPLVTYVFSEDEGVKAILRERTRSGSLVFNCTFLQMAVYELPYGGVGESGSGRSNKACMEEFSYVRSQIDVPMAMESHLEIFYPPYSEEATRAVARMGIEVALPESSPEHGIVDGKVCVKG